MMKRIITVLMQLLPFVVAAQATSEVQPLLRYRKYVSAEKQARSILNSQPLHTETWYWLSQTLVQKKDTASLLRLENDFPAALTNDAWIHVTRGNIELAKGRNMEARQHFDAAVSATRGKDRNLLAAVARANIYSGNGDKAYALEILKKAIKRNKKDPELFTLQGDAYFRLKDGSQAYQAFDNALKVDAAYAPALYEMGKIFATQNNDELFLRYYNETVNADTAFSPALYDLYQYYYRKDIGKASGYFTRYMRHTDVEASDEYLLADMLYLTKQYGQAINKAKELLTRSDAPNRLYKLVAYVYDETKQADSALVYMNQYFARGADSAYLLKDYDFMARIFSGMKGYEDSVIAYYERSLPLVRDEAVKASYYKSIAQHYEGKKDYYHQSAWLEKYYTNAPQTTNVDLFNWGVSLYKAGQYAVSDSVFGVYAEKYPEHVFGYYWRARANAAIDSTMKDGLAIPHYKKTIEIAEMDTASSVNKRYLVEAYGYLATYAVNEEKNYQAAIDYFEQLLEVDPLNADAKRYIEILEKTVGADTGSR